MILNTLLTILLLSSCTEKTTDTTEHIDNTDKKTYWYNNEAEISSYNLSQARYGELRDGNAVMIFVTEPFSTDSWTKADKENKDDLSVLKLNFTKKFNTGIYPYSMMTSTFFPFENGEHSLKITSSSQEWCGHTFMELRNKKKFEVAISSYFESETTDDFMINKDILENDIWSMIRLNPSNLPIGESDLIPSFFYLRLLHKKTKAYPCKLSSTSINDSITNYKINYLGLDRSLSINYETNFPHRILSWEENYYSGWGESRQRLTTSAELVKTIKSAYWTKNSNKDIHLRESLELDD